METRAQLGGGGVKGGASIGLLQKRKIEIDIHLNRKKTTNSIRNSRTLLM